MQNQRPGPWGLELGWIGLFLLLLVAAVWYQDRNAEIGPLAYQDVQHKLQRFPILDGPYRSLYADRKITRAEYRKLRRAYQALETSPQS